MMKYTQCYMESISLRTEVPTVYWEDNKMYISVVEAKIVTIIFQDINITVCFLYYQYGSGVFIHKYDKSAIIPDYMCKIPVQVPLSSKA